MSADAYHFFLVPARKFSEGKCTSLPASHENFATGVNVRLSWASNAHDLTAGALGLDASAARQRDRGPPRSRQPPLHGAGDTMGGALRSDNAFSKGNAHHFRAHKGWAPGVVYANASSCAGAPRLGDTSVDHQTTPESDNSHCKRRRKVLPGKLPRKARAFELKPRASYPRRPGHRWPWTRNEGSTRGAGNGGGHSFNKPRAVGFGPDPQLVLYP